MDKLFLLTGFKYLELKYESWILWNIYIFYNKLKTGGTNKRGAHTSMVRQTLWLPKRVAKYKEDVD